MSDKDKDDELDELLKRLNNSPSNNKEEKDEIVAPAFERKPPEIDVSIDDDLLMLAADSEESGGDLSEVFNKQLQKVASQYGAVFEEIIKNYKKDREQAQEVIDLFMDTVAAGGKVPRVYIEKIADAVRAKNEIAQTAIRALDSLPKLLSATKNNEMFVNNSGVSFDAANLKAILEAAKEADD